MPNTIKIKNSAVAAKVPLLTDLEYGEVALNYADGKIFYKRSDNTVQSISGSGGGTGDVTLAGTQTLTNKTIDYASNTLTGVQPTLVSGTSLKTVNGTSLLGSGDVTISGGGTSALTINNKTAAYTVVAGDLGKIINCTSGTFTVALTAAATLGAGFNCWIWNTSNVSTDVITINPAEAEVVDEVTTLTLRRGEGVQIICNGTNWETGDKKAVRGYAENLAFNLTRPIASGNASTAIGNFSTASGANSFAIGNWNSTAIGTASFSVNATANANHSVAIGRNSSTDGSVTATGAGAMALGGSYASGTDSFAAAVANNTSTYGAQGTNAIAIGKQAKATTAQSIAIGDRAVAASGGQAVAIGQLTTASGTSSVAISGYLATASGSGAIAIGLYTTASGVQSTALGCGAVSAISGKYAYAGEQAFGAPGAGQKGELVVYAATTGATPTALTSTGAAASTTNQVILPNNSAYAFSGTIVARQQASGGTQSAAWRVEGLIRREANAASTVLVNSNMTVLSNTPGWALTLTADTTNGGLAVTVTGAASTNIRWVATLQTSEVTYA